MEFILLESRFPLSKFSLFQIECVLFRSLSIATPADASAFISANYPMLTAANLTTISQLYPLMAPLPFHAAYFPSSSLAYGEATFKCPGRLVSRAMADAGLASSVWNYRFNQPNSITTLAGLGVLHKIDLGAFFGPFVSRFNDFETVVTQFINFASYEPRAENAAVVPIMMDYLISFVIHLNPNVQKSLTAITWQPFYQNGVERRVVIQDTGTYMETASTGSEQRCTLWENFIHLTGM